MKIKPNMLKKLQSHFEPSLTPVGVALALGMTVYILMGFFLLGVGRPLLGSAIFIPVVAVAARMAYGIWSTSLLKYPRTSKALGIVNALLVVGVFIYLGFQFQGLSKV